MNVQPRQHQRAPGRDGLWPAGGWETTDAPRGARQWAQGWDREARCPPDPMKRRGGSRTLGRAPEGGWCRGASWRESWEDSRQVARTLRRAGYVARHRWAKARAEDRQIGRNVLELWRYLDGPAMGEVAVDPWKAASAVLSCSGSWYKQLRSREAALSVVKAPRRCGRRHVCPICASKTSSSLAKAIRAVVEDRHQAGQLGGLVLATWTQRVNLDETLARALHRFTDAWQRMTQGRPGRRFKARIAGWYLGLEVTRSWPGKGQGAPKPESEAAMGWHVHAHVVAELEQGVSQEAARAALGRLWADASENAARAAGIPGFGWDPAAGGCAWADGPDGMPGAWDWSGAWWRPIDPESPAEVYQACKYPTPLAALGPVGMAEWLATSWGRRWHQGGGSWRSVRKLAKELCHDDAPPEVLDEDTGEIHTAPDLGQLAGGCGPGDAPPADEEGEEWASWRLLWTDDGAAPPGFNYLIWQAGGETYPRRFAYPGEPERLELWVRLPAAWVDWQIGRSEHQLQAFARVRDEIRQRRREAQERDQ